MGVVGWLMPSHGYSIPGNVPLPVVVEDEWTPGPVWKGVKNIARPGFDLRTVHP